MIGTELKKWRLKNGYRSQKQLQLELGIKSRTKISAWENSINPLPRVIQLALMSLENIPTSRKAYGRASEINESIKVKSEGIKFGNAIAKRDRDE